MVAVVLPCGAPGNLVLGYWLRSRTSDFLGGTLVYKLRPSMPNSLVLCTVSGIDCNRFDWLIYFIASQLRSSFIVHSVNSESYPESGNGFGPSFQFLSLET